MHKAGCGVRAPRRRLQPCVPDVWRPHGWANIWCARFDRPRVRPERPACHWWTARHAWPMTFLRSGLRLAQGFSPPSGTRPWTCGDACGTPAWPLKPLPVGPGQGICQLSVTLHSHHVSRARGACGRAGAPQRVCSCFPEQPQQPRLPAPSPPQTLSVSHRACCACCHHSCRAASHAPPCFFPSTSIAMQAIEPLLRRL